jgi:PTS system ascorbate-specific IIA component
MLLRDFAEKNRCIFVDSVDSWEEAIRKSCEPLMAEGIVDGSYAEEIIETVKNVGPYIVIIPGVAIPHCMECAKGAHGTAISFMKLENPVSFDDEDPEKTASVFFTLVSVNTEEHLKNMKQLFKMLTNEDLLAELMEVRTPDDLIRLDEKYMQ